MLQRIDTRSVNMGAYLLGQNGEVMGKAQVKGAEFVEVNDGKSFDDVMKDGVTVMEVNADGSVTNKTLHLHKVELPPNVRAGVEYRKSCCDFTHSAEFKTLKENADYTGMSDTEKYRAIYERYQYCFGENFHKAYAVPYPIDMSGEYGYDMGFQALKDFEKELREHFGDEYTIREIRREALYGDKTDEEVRQEIIDGYDLSDGLTFRELYEISDEIRRVGLDGGFAFRLDDLFVDYGTYWNPPKNNDKYAERAKWLDVNVSQRWWNEMEHVYSSCNSCGIFIHPNYMNTLSQIKASC